MPQKYETCTFGATQTKKSGLLSSGKYVFHVIKDDGSELYRSNEVQGTAEKKPVFDDILNKLTADGWELVGELLEPIYLAHPTPNYARTMTFRRAIGGSESSDEFSSKPIKALMSLKEQGYVTQEEYDKVLRRIYDSQ